MERKAISPVIESFQSLPSEQKELLSRFEVNEQSLTSESYLKYMLKICSQIELLVQDLNKLHGTATLLDKRLENLEDANLPN